MVKKDLSGVYDVAAGSLLGSATLEIHPAFEYLVTGAKSSVALTVMVENIGTKGIELRGF